MDLRRADVLLPVVGPVQILGLHFSRRLDVLADDHAVNYAADQRQETEDQENYAQYPVSKARPN